MECCAVVDVSCMVIPAMVLPYATRSLASMSFPSAAARGRYFAIFSIAERASVSLRIFTPFDIMTSVLWNSASNPWYAVYLDGTVFISSGSTTASTGTSSGAPPNPIFSWVSFLLITPQLLISEPVPAVRVIVTWGSGLFTSGCPLPVPPFT